MIILFRAEVVRELREKIRRRRCSITYDGILVHAHSHFLFHRKNFSAFTFPLLCDPTIYCDIMCVSLDMYFK